MGARRRDRKRSDRPRGRPGKGLTVTVDEAARKVGPGPLVPPLRKGGRSLSTAEYFILDQFRKDPEKGKTARSLWEKLASTGLQLSVPVFYQILRRMSRLGYISSSVCLYKSVGSSNDRHRVYAISDQGAAALRTVDSWELYTEPDVVSREAVVARTVTGTLDGFIAGGITAEGSGKVSASYHDVASGGVTVGGSAEASVIPGRRTPSTPLHPAYSQANIVPPVDLNPGPPRERNSPVKNPDAPYRGA